MVPFTTAVQVISFLYGLLLVCHGAEGPPPSNWDYLIFTQEWPQSACIAYKGDNSQRACEIFSNVTSWTVHGVWPTKAGTRGPHNCQKLPFDLEKLRKIEPNLLMSWPNIYAGQSVYSLWKHEWLKHGTCAAELPAIGDEHDYFALGLSWSAQYQPLAALADGGVKPGADGFTWEAIRAALAARYNTKIIVDCEIDRETKIWYLSQIKLCLDKSFEPTDCHNHTEPISTGCPEEGIRYPPIIPTPTFVPTPAPTPAAAPAAAEGVTEAEVVVEEEGEREPAFKEELVEIWTFELSKNEVEPSPQADWYNWYRYGDRAL